MCVGADRAREVCECVHLSGFVTIGVDPLTKAPFRRAGSDIFLALKLTFSLSSSVSKLHGKNME